MVFYMFMLFKMTSDFSSMTIKPFDRLYETNFLLHTGILVALYYLKKTWKYMKLINISAVDDILIQERR